MDKISENDSFMSDSSNDFDFIEESKDEVERLRSEKEV